MKIVDDYYMKIHTFIIKSISIIKKKNDFVSEISESYTLNFNIIKHTLLFTHNYKNILTCGLNISI